MHYRNGVEAKVGDLVVGTTFNTDGRIISGTLVSLTPGPDACSAKVGYLGTRRVDSAKDYGIGMLQGTESHGSGGPLAITSYMEDFTECKYLLRAADAFYGWEKWSVTPAGLADLTATRALVAAPASSTPRGPAATPETKEE